VLRLVADGLTNKEIARQLIVSENTVKTHLTSLFNKLGVNSRARAVAVAASGGLLT
jgi:DNA-binding NarL/FixJ family response regulator